jgi:dihydrofolate synthase/folylpolyglutamate synthase
VAFDPLDWLFGLAQFGIKFGLENIRSIVEELGHPERAFRSVHVAGTNGKGSVTAMVEASLRSASIRTGRYTSPHLVDLSERFAVDGAPVSHPDLHVALGTVHDAVESLRQRGTLQVHPTFFEVTTAVAFELFRRKSVDVAVCEVGLGGRLDATNVLSPAVCAITSIAFDHEQYLGHTIREIASEKAGIIKRDTPVVVGRVESEAAAAIQGRADVCNARVIQAWAGVAVGRQSWHRGDQRFALRTPVRDYGEIRLNLDGQHQIDNAVVAVRLIEELEKSGIPVGREAIAKGLASVAWPGRLQYVQVDEGHGVLLDAAHNAAGSAALSAYLSMAGPARPLVFAAMKDKDAAAMLRELAPRVSHIVVTRASNPRSSEPLDLAAIARAVAPDVPVEIADSPESALRQAWEYAPDIVVAGSIFLLGDALKVLGRT